jgi:hypothetical protein
MKLSLDTYNYEMDFAALSEDSQILETEDLDIDGKFNNYLIIEHWL